MVETLKHSVCVALYPNVMFSYRHQVISMSAALIQAIASAAGRKLRSKVSSNSEKTLTNEELLEEESKNLSNRQIRRKNRIYKDQVTAIESTKELIEMSICKSNKKVGKKPELIDISSRSSSKMGMINKSKDIAIEPPEEEESGLRYYYLKCPSCENKCMHVTSLFELIFDGETYRKELGKYEKTPFESGVSDGLLKSMLQKADFKSDKYKCSNCKEENKMEWGKCSRNKGMFDKGDPCKGAIKGYNTVILKEENKSTSLGYCTQCGENP